MDANVLWFTTNRGAVGIVKKQDPITKEFKFYIGIGLGNDENIDAEYIRQFGSKIPRGFLLKFLQDDIGGD